MMFSVIIPYYKNLEIVHRSLNSVLAQEVEDWEIILVDDGSEDNIDSIINEYNDDRIVLKHKSNGGVASARNYGIQCARYPYICFLDSDDEWLPNHLSTLTRMIETYPQADMFVTSHRRIGNTVTESCSHLPPHDSAIFTIENLLKVHYENGGTTHTNSVCMKANFLRQMGGFNESASIGEDSDLWFRSSFYTVPVFTDVVTTVYYRDYSFLTKSVRHNYQWAFLDQYNNESLTPEKRHYANLICERYILSLCKHLLAEGNKKECNELFRRLNRSVCSEMSKNYQSVRLMRCLPSVILKPVGKAIYRHQLNKY